MINGKKLVLVLPAFNAAKTLQKTHEEIPHNIVDEIILVDDFSSDNTIELANKLGIKVVKHQRNLGYGGNQKTCYKQALKEKAEIIVMLHPDYQYDPKLIKPMAELIADDKYDIVLGSRFFGTNPIEKGMPAYKYLANRVLTFFQNLVFDLSLSEYHTGYRAFSAEFLRKTKFEDNSNDFLFDNQLIAQAIYHNYKVGEVSCPARYEDDSSSIGILKSVKYAIGVGWVSLQYLLSKVNLAKFKLFKNVKD
jgi:glycosyltransferase involved in cell wall biosynthesis